MATPIDREHATDLDRSKVTISVYQRCDLARHGEIQHHLDRLSQLEVTGRIDCLDYHLVPGRLVLNPATDQPISWIDELRAAADRLDISLEPGLQRRDRYNAIEQQHEHIITTPLLLVAIRDADDTIQAIAPAKDGDRTIAVRDLIDRFAEENQSALTV